MSKLTTLPGFPLAGGREPDSEINHEVLGADICNGVKLKKTRMSRFFPMFVIQRIERSACPERRKAKSTGSG